MGDFKISEFYEQILSDKGFQEPETGNLFFPAYIYTYKPEDEYKIRKEIKGLKNRLIRPNNHIDVMIINIFDEFISYLKSAKVGDDEIYSVLLDKELSDADPKSVHKLLSREANGEKFIMHLKSLANKHFGEVTEKKKVYLFVYGFGSVFPFIRASKFLKKYEKHLSGYKLIVFYPGIYENKNYQLFNEFNDENIYRAVPVDSMLRS